jgi:hypothetical protein
VSDSKLLEDGTIQQTIPETPDQSIEEIPEIPAAEIPETEIPETEN